LKTNFYIQLQLQKTYWFAVRGGAFASKHANKMSHHGSLLIQQANSYTQLYSSKADTRGTQSFKKCILSLTFQLLMTAASGKYGRGLPKSTLTYPHLEG
jgi:hypothetical protein